MQSTHERRCHVELENEQRDKSVEIAAAFVGNQRLERNAINAQRTIARDGNVINFNARVSLSPGHEAGDRELSAADFDYGTAIKRCERSRYSILNRQIQAELFIRPKRDFSKPIDDLDLINVQIFRATWQKQAVHETPIVKPTMLKALRDGFVVCARCHDNSIAKLEDVHG